MIACAFLMHASPLLPIPLPTTPVYRSPEDQRGVSPHISFPVVVVTVVTAVAASATALVADLTENKLTAFVQKMSLLGFRRPRPGSRMDVLVTIIFIAYVLIFGTVWRKKGRKLIMMLLLQGALS